jgi:Skp family chaperone for outer membrane proteins
MYKLLKLKKYYSLGLVLIFLFIGSSYAEYPSTSIGVIDLNYILSESKSAKDAAKQIEDIAIKVEKEIATSDQELIDEQNKLIESQSIMAPDAFEEKRIEYEKKVQNYNVSRQDKLLSIDKMVNDSRNSVLDALRPILEEISNEKGITILLEKNSVLLNAENMDITNEAIQMLDKQLPKIKVNQE